MNYCQLEKESECTAVCKVCGRKIRTKNPAALKVKCLRGYGSRDGSPSLGSKVMRYATAAAGHILSGGETRNDVEVQERFQLCQDCEYFNSAQSVCDVCGCKVNQNKNAFLNKLRMKSQQCPKGKWR